MGRYNFDKVIERRGTGALKYDVLQERYGVKDLLPLWVADMDFETPPFVVDAIKKRMEHPVFGYTKTPDELWSIICRWVAEHHGWQIKEEWLTYIPGIVRGIGMAINVFVKEDEKVIIQPPVYHPFRLTTLGNNREVVYNPLRRNIDGSYEMDFENLSKVTDDKCRMLVLSNPHNPGGIVWDRKALIQLADFCHSRNIIVISDEIHCDMTLWNNKHIPFASVSPEAAACSITFGAPSKTFNIAGIVSSYAVVPNDDLRERFFRWLSVNELNEPAIFSPIATIAAFNEGEEWRKEMLRYVEDNIDFTIDFCREHIPMVKPLRPQASFLVWLDCTAMQLSQPQLVDLFVKKAGLALNDGTIFGKEGEGFMRLNVGCPRTVLKEALERLEKAVNE
ncbi:MAG: PatB family C-S lyase [Bacteroidaceae bacterium]|nr:PatB family C-S lyase [Bacteroidaceae bacterium]